MSDQHTTSSQRVLTLLLALLPLVLLGLLVAWFIAADPAKRLRPDVPPIEELSFQRVLLEPDLITLELINDGPDPVTIAQVAGESAAVGFASFLMLLAYPSITLGIINLLPVPMLDGGWILFGIIEMIRGRSLPERFLMTAQGVGLTLVVSFMLLAIYNDLVRQFS